MNFPEKYRPTSFNQIIGPVQNINFLKNLSKNDNLTIPALLFAGPPGCGKTTLAKVFTLTRFQDDSDRNRSGSSITSNKNANYLEINASLDRTITSIKEKIVVFLAMIPDIQNSSTGKFSRKIIFFDEVDSMTIMSQEIIARNLIKTYSGQCLFIFACNNCAQVSNNIVSQSLPFYFEKLSDRDMYSLMDGIDKDERKAKDASKSCRAIKTACIHCSNGDARKLLNIYEMVKTMNLTESTSTNQVFKQAGVPNKQLILRLLNYITIQKSFKKSVKFIKDVLIQEYAFCNEDIIESIYNFLKYDKFEYVKNIEIVNILLSEIYEVRVRMLCEYRNSLLEMNGFVARVVLKINNC